MPPSAVLVPLLNVILTSFNEQSQVHIVKNEGSLAQIISRTTVFHINGAFHFYYVPTSVNGISYNGAQLGYSVDGTIHFLTVMVGLPVALHWGLRSGYIISLLIWIRVTMKNAATV